MVARQSHKLKVAGSTPASATNGKNLLEGKLASYLFDPSTKYWDVAQLIRAFG